MRSNRTIRGVAIVAACLLGAASTATGAATSRSMDDLSAAFAGESNAHARYVAFAAQAEREGYGAVSSLFRAAATAEEIHASSHAAAIRKLGGTPRADVATPEVKTTAENLQAAIRGETYERDTMYPKFLADARAEKNTDAIRSFNHALSAEAEHAKLYQAALDDLAGWKTERVTFYVCPVCGYTVRTIDFAKCPTCFTKREKYLAIS
jgi:rubrerythrin